MTSAALDLLGYSAGYDQQPTEDDDLECVWRAGELSWLLDENQLAMYEQYRAWEALDPHEQPGQHPLIFVCECGKRVGKTTLFLVIKIEDCIRKPGTNHRYASAFAKNIDEIVTDVAGYVFETCPAHLRPRYVGASANKPARYLFEQLGDSELRLVGLDQNPDGLRGRASDGDVIGEAAFVRHLRYAVQNVIVHQYQGRPDARLILESSAPVDADTHYDMHYVPDARERPMAFMARTLEDNPRLSRKEKDLFIREAGGMEDPECRREYFNERVRDPERTIVPEFDAEKHIKKSALPSHGHAYVSIDPGTTHLCAVLWGYWDFDRQKLVVQRSWAERNANTSAVAGVCKTAELDLWQQEGAQLAYWDGRELQRNPYRRYIDSESAGMRMALDFKRDHGLQVYPTAKDEADSWIAFMRNMFLRDVIEIWPDSGPLEAHLRAGTKNDKGNWDEHPTYGHFDLIASLQYLCRNVARGLNPNVPSIPHPGDATKFVRKELVQRQKERSHVTKLNEALGSGNTLRFRGRR